MVWTYRALLLLALAAPGLLFGDVAYWAYVTAFAAIGIPTVLTADRSALRRTWSTGRPAWLGGAVAIAVLAAQLAPWAPPTLSNPIWRNASEALGGDLGATISLDPGATIGSLASLVFALAVVLIVALATTVRLRAGGLFRTICGSLYLAVGLLTIGHRLSWASDQSVSALSALGCIGLITAASLAFGSAGPASRPARAGGWSRRLDLALGGLGGAVSALALLSIPDPAALCLALAGAAVAIGAARLRGPRFGSRISLAIALFATLLCALALRSDRLSSYPSALQAGRAAAVSPATASRMLSDAPRLGTGGGTFQLLADIYRQGSQEKESQETTAPPSLAVKLQVEFGWLGLLSFLFCWLFMALEMLAGAQRRSRDRYLCAAAAAIALIFPLLALLDTGLTAAPVQVIGAILAGIALTQRISPDI